MASNGFSTAKAVVKRENASPVRRSLKSVIGVGRKSLDGIIRTPDNILASARRLPEIGSVAMDVIDPQRPENRKMLKTFKAFAGRQSYNRLLVGGILDKDIANEPDQRSSFADKVVGILTRSGTLRPDMVIEVLSIVSAEDYHELNVVKTSTAAIDEAVTRRFPGKRHLVEPLHDEPLRIPSQARPEQPAVGFRALAHTLVEEQITVEQLEAKGRPIAVLAVADPIKTAPLLGIPPKYVEDGGWASFDGVGGSKGMSWYPVIDVKYDQSQHQLLPLYAPAMR